MQVHLSQPSIVRHSYDAGSQRHIICHAFQGVQVACCRYEQQMRDEVQRRQQLEGELGTEDLGDLELQQEEASLPADLRELYVPATGAKITFASAKHRLYYFCDKLPSDK